MMPLTMLQTGQKGRIVTIHGGRGLRSHLLSMGFAPGESVEILNGITGHGPVLVALKGTRIALCRGMAHKIFVE